MSESAAEPPPAQPSVRSLAAADGTPLLYRAWEVSSPRACVHVVHGLGEHGGRYAQLAVALLDRQISVHVPDLRGHGVSGGRRGHVRRFEEYLSDLQLVRGQVACGSPTFLLGHSLGGLIALRAVQTGRAGTLSGLILSAPALQLAGPANRWRDVGGAILSRVAPTLALQNGIDPADLSRSSREVDAYRSDPLVHDRITPRLYTAMRAAMSAAADAATGVAVPALVLLSGSDRIVSSPTARAVAERFARRARIVEYPDYFHEPLHERQPDRAIDEIVGWIEARLA